MKLCRCMLTLCLLICSQRLEAAGNKGNVRLNGMRLAEKLWEVAHEGMGLKQIQEKYDEYGELIGSSTNWKTLTEQLAKRTGSKFNQLTQALKNLKEGIERYYTSHDTRAGNSSFCCNLSSSSLKYQEAFKNKVDTHQTCMRYAPYNRNPKQLPKEYFHDIARRNLGNHSLSLILRWQYHGTEEGNLEVYPAFNASCTYEARTRPWYIQTFAPQPKDIVIVMDRTGKADTKVLKDTILGIIETTSPNDRIGVIQFGDGARTPEGHASNSTCYREKLALATPRNKNYLMWFIQQTDGYVQDEAAKFRPALRVAFGLFKETGDTTRRRFLLFFTNSNPNDPRPEDLVTFAKQQNSDLDNSVTIITYAAGGAITTETEELLHGLRTKDGHFSRLNSTANLRSNLGSYYKKLGQPFEEPLFVLPYVDLWGLGLVISICMPYHDQNQVLKGVVCLDGRVSDLLAEVTHFRKGVDAYSFIIDRQRHVIHHHSVSQPNDTKARSLNIDISMVETGNELQDIISEMTEGKSGGKSVRTTLVKPKASFPGQWVEAFQTRKFYQWTHIPNSSYSLCLVSTAKDIPLNINVRETPLNPNNIELKCSHQQLSATLDSSSVSYDTKAFTKECYPDERNPTEKCLRDYIKQEELVSGSVDTIWKSDSCKKYNQAIIWRHLITLGGVKRTYPAVNIEMLEPLRLPWYVKALTYAGTLILTKQSTQSESLITISHVIYEGRSTQIHDENDIPVAVVGAELKDSYLSKMVVGLFPACIRSDISCFLVDESGEVLFHSDVIEDRMRSRDHILNLEPSISDILISKKILINGSCNNVERLQVQHYWKISSPAGVYHNDEVMPFFDMQVIHGTNTYLFMRTTPTEKACPVCKFSWNETCTETRGCKCPCFSHLQFDFCKYTFSTEERTGPNFTCPLPTLPLVRPAPAPPPTLPPCVQRMACHDATSESDCSLLPDCLWCQVPGRSDMSCSPLDKCDFTDQTCAPDTLLSIVIGISAALLFLLVVHLILLFLCYRTKRACFSRTDKKISSSPSSKNIPHRHLEKDASSSASTADSTSSVRKSPFLLQNRPPAALPNSMKMKQPEKDPDQRYEDLPGVYLAMHSSQDPGSSPTPSKVDSRFSGPGSVPSGSSLPSPTTPTQPQDPVKGSNFTPIHEWDEGYIDLSSARPLQHGT